MVYLSRGDSASLVLYRQPFDPERDTSGQRSVVFEAPGGLNAESFGISPDGRNLIVATYQTEGTIVMAENVPELVW